MVHSGLWLKNSLSSSEYLPERYLFNFCFGSVFFSLDFVLQSRFMWILAFRKKICSWELCDKNIYHKKIFVSLKYSSYSISYQVIRTFKSWLYTLTAAKQIFLNREILKRLLLYLLEFRKAVSLAGCIIRSLYAAGTCHSSSVRQNTINTIVEE